MTTNKITLVTPPDIYENSNFSISFLGLTEDQQTAASVWMGKNEDFPPCNFYYYEGENNIPWLLFALNRSNAIFLNLDVENAIINIMGSYILGKSGVFYTTRDPNLKSLISHINNNYVESVEVFLEKVFNEQRTR
jgi:hypothetical protein